MAPQSFGATIAVAVVVADQFAKSAVLRYAASLADIPSSLGPFLDLTVRWNRGISFSLFQTDTVGGRTILLAFTGVAIVFLVSWLLRCSSILVGAGLGAIIGGATGNAIDRVQHGAVVDFLDLHAFGRHFFVFNLADAAINIGIGLLIVDLLLRHEGSYRGNNG